MPPAHFRTPANARDASPLSTIHALACAHPPGMTEKDGSQSRNYARMEEQGKNFNFRCHLALL